MSYSIKILEALYKKRWIIASVVTIVFCFFVLNSFYYSTDKYPEEEYKYLENFFEKIIDVENKTIHYGIAIPGDIILSYEEIISGLRISVTKNIGNNNISCYALLTKNNEIIFSRDYKDIGSYKSRDLSLGLLLTFLFSIFSYALVLMLFVPIKYYLVRKNSDIFSQDDVGMRHNYQIL